MGDNNCSCRTRFMDPWSPPTGLMAIARVGSRMTLRCGIVLTVKKITPMTLESGAQTIEWVEDYENTTYHDDGTAWAGGKRYIGNIHAIENSFNTKKQPEGDE